jgi:hypothetical protein
MAITRLRWGWILALFVVLPLLIAYVGSYAYLSRRGMREAETWGFKFFFYVPLDDPDLRKNDLTKQIRLVTFYAPVNWIDRTLLNGKQPCTAMDLSIAGRPDQE